MQIYMLKIDLTATFGVYITMLTLSHIESTMTTTDSPL